MVANINAWFIAGLLVIIGQAIAVYYSYVIYKYNRLSAGWLAVTFALALTILNRLIIFSSDFGFFPELNPLVLKTWNVMLLLFISALLIWGFWSMKKSFESFDVVEKKTQDKIQAFQRSKKKR